MNINNLSGLQIMQEMCNDNLPIPSMATTIPMSASEVELGYVMNVIRTLWGVYMVALLRWFWIQ